MIVDKVTKAGEQAAYSIVPPKILGYEVAVTPSSSREADLLEAVALLAEAGYGEGLKPLPAIEVHYNTSEQHRSIAEVIASEWKNKLGLSVTLKNQEWKAYLDAQTQLQYQVSRAAWIGDYYDPNTFLDMFCHRGRQQQDGMGQPLSTISSSPLLRQRSTRLNE